MSFEQDENSLDEHESEDAQFSILKYVNDRFSKDSNDQNKNLYAIFLCQYNKDPAFLKRTQQNVYQQDFFDYSHKFLLQIPIYATAKLAQSNLAVLLNSNISKADFQRLLNFIDPTDTCVKAAPETNQQQIINCFVLTAKTWNDYNFFLKIQKDFDCFYDFDFIDFEQYLYIELELNPGNVFSTRNLKRANQIQNVNLNIQGFCSKSFQKYIFTCTSSCSANDFRYRIKNFLTSGKEPLFYSLKNANFKSWTSVAYDIECGRLKSYDSKNEEPVSMSTPLDSYIQTICCIVPKNIKSSLDVYDSSKKNESFYKFFNFVNIRNREFQSDITSCHKKNLVNNIFYFYFDNEKKMIGAVFLFLSMFNQIVDQNGLSFDLPFMVHRYNILDGKFSKLNYISIGWPFSIQSSIFAQFQLKCTTCKSINTLKNDTNLICDRCNQTIHISTENSSIKMIKYKKSFTCFPLSIHIDLQYFSWAPNITLKKGTINSSLAELSKYWFKKKVVYYNYQRNRNKIIIFCEVSKLSSFKELILNFGNSKNQMILFENIKGTINQKISGQLEAVDFYVPTSSLIKAKRSDQIDQSKCSEIFEKDVDSDHLNGFFDTNNSQENIFIVDNLTTNKKKDLEKFSFISEFKTEKFDTDVDGFITFFINTEKEYSSDFAYSNFYIPPEIDFDGNNFFFGFEPPKNLFVSFTKIDIDSFVQRNPKTSRDYINVIEYCMIDTLLTINLSILSKNHIYCLGASTYKLPIYMCYIAHSGNIANYIDSWAKYNYLVVTRNNNKWKQYLLFLTCKLIGRKTDEKLLNENLTNFKFGKAMYFDIATNIPDLFTGELNISETNLNLIGENPINSIGDLESSIERLISNKD